MQRRSLVFVACLSILAGCSRGPAVSTIPVSGKITYNGAPLAEAIVTFVNVDPDGRSANGVTDANGAYTLQTFVTPGRSQAGAMAGDYTVTVTKFAAAAVTTVTPGSMENLSPEEMAKKGAMAQPKKRDMNSPGDKSPTPEAAKSLAPEKYGSPKTSDLKATVSASNREFPFELKD